MWATMSATSRGWAADIFESYVGSVIATIAIGATSAQILSDQRLAAVTLPVLYVMIGLLASVVGIFSMKAIGEDEPGGSAA